MYGRLEKLVVPYWRAFRRRPKSTKQRYKPTMRYLRSTEMRQKLDELSEIHGYKGIKQLVSNKNVDNLKLSELRSILMKDILCDDESQTMIRLMNYKGKERASHLADRDLYKKNWRKLAPLLMHPLHPVIEPIKPGALSKGVDYAYKIRVSTTDTKFSLDEVWWPSIDMSNQCRGIGISKDAYPELTDSDLTSIHAINPFNQVKLPIIRVDFIPFDDQAVGLFPLQEPKHKAAFDNDPITKASILVRSDKYTIPKTLDLKNIIVSDVKEEKNNRDNGDEIVEDGFKTTNFKTLLKYCNEICHLWTESDGFVVSSPPDIIRATLFNTNFNRISILTEFMAHYTTFSSLAKIDRLVDHWSKIGDVGSEIDIKTHNWKPWDLQLMNKFNDLENSFKNLNRESEISLIRYKNKLEDFFTHLYLYCQILEAEMKEQLDLFFLNGDTIHKISRANEVVTLFNSIFHNPQMFNIFYKSTFNYMFPKITTPKLKAQKDCFNIIENNSEKMLLGEHTYKIAEQILIFEDMMYKNNFGKPEGPNTRSTLKANTQNFQIFIISPTSLPREVMSIIMFLTKIKTVFLESTQDMKPPPMSACIEKHALPEYDTLMYLYQYHPRTPKKVEPLVSDVIQKLRITV